MARPGAKFDSLNRLFRRRHIGWNRLPVVFVGETAQCMSECRWPGAQSFLWASSDNGQTWFDTAGRTEARHTAFVLLKDGSILGMGGKGPGIDGYMKQAISKDGGKTGSLVSRPFPALSYTGQRPTLIRLASGRLFHGL